MKTGLVGVVRRIAALAFLAHPSGVLRRSSSAMRLTTPTGLDFRRVEWWHHLMKGLAGIGVFALVLAWALPAGAEEAPRYLNLDFESPGYPRDWYTGGEGYSVELDSTVAFSGRQSLRIGYVRPGTIGIASQQLPVSLAAGRRLRVSASVRTESVATGWAGIWCRVDGIDRLLAYATTRGHGSTGTTAWARQDLEVAVDSTATAVTFGPILAGDGVAWFDRFEISLNGAPYVEPPAPAVPDPGPAELIWLRAHAIPFDTDDPARDGLDLVPILHLVGNARVVGLGEGTHGTREFSRMKHRLVRALVEDLGFDHFAMESNYPETERLNRYVRTGEGDPRAILRDMHLWTWNTEEVLDLVQWMRAYNASGRHPVQFQGFDMQRPIASIDSLTAFIRRADPDYGGALAESLRIVARAHDADARGPVGSATVLLRGEPFSGKRVRLSGWIRTEAVEEGEAALWLRADGDTARTAYDGMEGRGPRGTTGWARYVAEIRVPPGSRRVALGTALRGDGAAWFDSLAVEVDGRTAHDGGSFDFGFESRRPLGGLRAAGLGYRVEIDTTTARFGRRSLVLRQDPVAAAAAHGDRWARAIGAAEGILHHVEAESLALAARADEPEVAQAIQNARFVLQACRGFANPPTRDASMAENAEWLLSRAPAGSKLILWAHNAHVSRRAGAMGGYLDARFGAGYRNVGFAFHEGSYIASDRSGLHVFPAMPSQPGSLEWALHRTGLPRLALDLHQASSEDSASAWLTRELDFRNIGALPVPHGFYRTNVAHDFDTVIYFDRTTPTRPLLSRSGP